MSVGLIILWRGVRNLVLQGAGVSVEVGPAGVRYGLRGPVP